LDLQAPSLISPAPRAMEKVVRRDSQVGLHGRTLQLFELAQPEIVHFEGIEGAEQKRQHREFMKKYPDFAALDHLRESEYSQLDATIDPESGGLKLPEIYLDYTGAMQGGRSHILQTAQLVTSLALGNPHSSSQTSMKSTGWVHKAEEAVLRHLNTTVDQYQVIWTANASGASRLMAQYYNFGKPLSGGALAICADNHNSVHGIREAALERGADVSYIPVDGKTLHVDATKFDAILSGNFKAGVPYVSARKVRGHKFSHLITGSSAAGGNKLLAYPAQSNVSGVKHSLNWIGKAQAQGWDVFLDAAAFLPSNSLDLSLHQPDFISMSFYKLFGHPTGVGALVVRQDKAHMLLRKEGWFAGGTIAFNTVAGFGADREKAHEMAPGKDRFEEGTVNYSNFIGVKCGLDYLKRINDAGARFRAGLDGQKWEPSPVNDMNTITLRVRQLTNFLLEELNGLMYPSGQKLVQIYGRSLINDTQRGGTIPINVMDDQGDFVPYGLIEEMANRHHISIRTGCFCNPGIHEAYNFLSVAEVGQVMGLMPDHLRQTDSTHTQWELNRQLDNPKKMLGCIRISVGFPTNFNDVYRFMVFMKGLLGVDWKAKVAQFKDRIDGIATRGPSVRASLTQQVACADALIDRGETLRI